MASKLPRARVVNREWQIMMICSSSHQLTKQVVVVFVNTLVRANLATLSNLSDNNVAVINLGFFILFFPLFSFFLVESITKTNKIKTIVQV